MSKNKNIQKVKKPITKRPWFWILVVLIILVIVGAVSGGTKKDQPTATSEEAAPAEEVVAASEPAGVSFVLDGDTTGDYGEEVVLNAGTEFEEKEVTYHIPAGAYTVKNAAKDGSTQITIYSGGPEKTGEWEEFVADDACPAPVVLMAGDEKELEIKDGQFVVLSDGGNNVEFTQK